MTQKNKNTFDPQWSECNDGMMRWAERELRAGNVDKVTAIMNMLPKDKREKYRQMYARVMKELKR